MHLTQQSNEFVFPYERHAGTRPFFVSSTEPSTPRPRYPQHQQDYYGYQSFYGWNTAPRGTISPGTISPGAISPGVVSPGSISPRRQSVAYHNRNFEDPVNREKSNRRRPACYKSSSPSSSLAAGTFQNDVCTHAASSGKDRKAIRMLSPDFQPTAYSVIFGRGAECFNSTGNRRFRATAELFLEEYSNATTKAEKSGIVSRLIEIVREASPEGSFIRSGNGRWWEVSDAVAREKVGAQMRDLLHTKYRSSTKAKIEKRRQASSKAREAKKNNLQGSISPQSLEVVLKTISLSCDEDDEDSTTPISLNSAPEYISNCFDLSKLLN